MEVYTCCSCKSEIGSDGYPEECPVCGEANGVIFCQDIPRKSRLQAALEELARCFEQEYEVEDKITVNIPNWSGKNKDMTPEGAVALRKRIMEETEMKEEVNTDHPDPPHCEPFFTVGCLEPRSSRFEVVIYAWGERPKAHTKTIAWQGEVEEVPCTEHKFAWSGKIPCTGVYRCVLCGAEKEE